MNYLVPGGSIKPNFQETTKPIINAADTATRTINALSMRLDLSPLLVIDERADPKLITTATNINITSIFILGFSIKLCRFMRIAALGQQQPLNSLNTQSFRVAM